MFTPIGGGASGTGGTTGGVGAPGGTTGGSPGFPGSGGPGSTTGGPGSTTGGPGSTTGGPGSTTGGPGSTTGGPGSTTGGPGSTTGGPGSTTGGPGSTTGGPGSTMGATGGTTGGPGSTMGGGGMGPPPPAKLSAAKGPLQTANLTLRSGTAYYPSSGTGPFPGVAIIPGFLNSGPEMTDWGPFLASWGIVTVVTNSGSLDTPDLRGGYLGDAVKEMKAENTKQGSKLFGKMSGSYGTSGYSMGGGGSTLASTSDKTLKSSVGLAPWTPVGRGITTPTLHFCGDVDIVADCSHAQASYDEIPATTDKMMITVSGCDHLTCWFGPGDTPSGVSGGWALAFHKVYLENDLRWKPLLMGPPPSSTVQTNIK